MNHSESVDRILEGVFARERAAFLEKQKALRDLRERFSGKKYTYFEKRIAYSIPNADKVLADMEAEGWKNTDFSYLRFCEWRDEVKADFFMIGEIIWQSSFYLLTGNNQTRQPDLERLIETLCRVASKQWHAFDGHPPRKIDAEDLCEFFAPNDIITCLAFGSEKDEDLKVILPYQALFALAKSAS